MKLLSDKSGLSDMETESHVVTAADMRLNRLTYHISMADHFKIFFVRPRNFFRTCVKRCVLQPVGEYAINAEVFVV